jgi:hypothetical protein
MVLNLAYTADEGGDPVPWNETRWLDDEFDELLKEANGTLDLAVCVLGHLVDGWAAAPMCQAEPSF